MVSWALITDVIDYSEIKNGIREDGSVYALYSFARKLGQAGASGLVGLLLELIGYNSSTAFDPSVTQGIFNISTLVPAVGFVALALVLWFWYPLHKKQVDQNVEKLRVLHAAQEATQPGEPLAVDISTENLSDNHLPDNDLSAKNDEKDKDKRR